MTHLTILAGAILLLASLALVIVGLDYLVEKVWPLRQVRARAAAERAADQS